ncbi:MAG: dihydroorotate dehydrogenase electron transfer subunit [Thermoanaerobaculia bacterium]
MRDVRVPLRHRESYGPGLFSISFELPDLASSLLPGQFAMLGVPGRSRPYLRRAFSIADSPGGAAIEFLVKTVGVGTACLEGLGPGDSVEVLGPLGNAFTVAGLSRSDRIAIVAGGVGVAPFPLLLRALGERGVPADLFFGGRSAADLAYRRKISALVGLTGGEEFDATDDGSFGERARVTEVLARRLEAGTRYSRVFACGPTAMFRSLAPIVERFSLSAEFSTEAAMGCGFGVCLACVLPRPEGGYLVSCKEGPILAPARVAWDKC